MYNPARIWCGSVIRKQGDIFLLLEKSQREHNSRIDLQNMAK